MFKRFFLSSLASLLAVGSASASAHYPTTHQPTNWAESPAKLDNNAVLPNSFPRKLQTRIILAQGESEKDAHSDSINQEEADSTAKKAPDIEADTTSHRARLKDAVDRALGPSVTTKQEPPLDEEVNSTRHRLLEVIKKVPPPEDSDSASYISKLRDEAATTVVIDEETAQRQARPATAAGLTDQSGLLREEDAFYIYATQPGDSLWKIAERAYDNGYRYVKIYKANLDSLKHENSLTVGQVLRIPKAGVVPSFRMRDPSSAKKSPLEQKNATN